MKLLYKPFGIVVGLIAGFLARQVFSQIWGHIDDREPPKPTDEESSWGKVLGAAAVQGRDVRGHEGGRESQRRQGLSVADRDLAGREAAREGIGARRLPAP